MLDKSGVSVALDSKVVPILPGFADVITLGIVSTLHESNALVGPRIVGINAKPAWLFDPQTSGGLIAGVNPIIAEKVVQRLRAAGMNESAVIGRVIECEIGSPTIHLTYFR